MNQNVRDNLVALKHFAASDWSTGPLDISVTSAATATGIMAANQAVLDGSTRVAVEVTFPRVDSPTSYPVEGILYLTLWEDTTDLGILAALVTVSTGERMFSPVAARRILTPAAGTHNYTAKAYVSAGVATVYGGVGGSGAYLPATIRVVGAPQ